MKQKCPVCNGTGLVSTPPGVAGDPQECVKTSPGQWQCEACLEDANKAKAALKRVIKTWAPFVPEDRKAEFYEDITVLMCETSEYAIEDLMNRVMSRLRDGR